MSKPIISIIIPVYNTSLYLEQCLNSIYNQTFKNYEIICVDDGSTDDSLSILKEYENKFENYRVIYQENSGVATARNKGLKEAIGEYIIFIDSDDFVEPNYLETLYNTSCSTNSDVVICNFYRYYDSRNIKLPVLYKKRSGIYSKDEILKALIPDNLIHSYLWNKLWRKELFGNFEFPNIKYEDLAIMSSLFYKSKKVSVIDDTLYYYRIRKTSIVRNYSIGTQNDYIRAFGFIRLFLERENLFKQYKTPFKFLSIKVFLVMCFINIFLINEYKNLNITRDNFKSIYAFIKSANSSSFNYTYNKLLNISVLNPIIENTSIYNKSTD